MRRFTWFLNNILFFSLFVSIDCSVATEMYTFNDPVEKQIFETITRNMRCVVCDNQSLYESMAPMSHDLKQEIARQIQAGCNPTDIIQFMEERYGEFILYQPPFKLGTYVLWLSPFIFFLIALRHFVFNKRVS